METIDLTASRLQKLLGPEVRIVIGHGKMNEQQISSAMQRMVDGEAEVLVCTTIIETGIDIPNVNTLIIEDADQMGLSQLHQIRGRIGRSARRAYAYMTFRRGKVLSEIATKRLTAIKEYVEFGSGFKIAMRDLEIRGAGNLLGPEQSGYMMPRGPPPGRSWPRFSCASPKTDGEARLQEDPLGSVPRRVLQIVKKALRKEFASADANLFNHFFGGVYVEKVPCGPRSARSFLFKKGAKHLF